MSFKVEKTETKGFTGWTVTGYGARLIFKHRSEVDRFLDDWEKQEREQFIQREREKAWGQR